MHLKLKFTDTQENGSAVRSFYWTYNPQKSFSTTITHHSHCCLNFAFYKLHVTFRIVTGTTTVISRDFTQMSHVSQFMSPLICNIKQVTAKSVMQCMTTPFVLRDNHFHRQIFHFCVVPYPVLHLCFQSGHWNTKGVLSFSNFCNYFSCLILAHVIFLIGCGPKCLWTAYYCTVLHSLPHLN